MRRILIMFWLLVPVVVMAYHYGPGQKRMVVDDAAAQLQQGEAFLAAEEWEEAVAKMDEALRLLPDDRIAEIRRVRLEKAKAQMFIGQMPDARRDLAALVEEMTASTDDGQSADQTVLQEARSALANSQYYMTWLMRLEGLPEDEWKPEVEAARQTYRLLAEEATAAGDDAFATKAGEDLEATIRLARMDLGELQGLPLPSQ